MKWASALSTDPNLQAAIKDMAQAVRQQLDGKKPDLLFLFVSAYHKGVYATAQTLLRQQLPSGALVGCSASGVVGSGVEVERGPGISLMAGVMPGVTIDTVHANLADMPDADDSPQRWRDWVQEEADTYPAFILLVDPFHAAIENFLLGLDYAFPRSPKIGGMASGAGEPGQNALFMGDVLYREGAVLVKLKGDLVLDTIIAQGCRPVGPPFTITAVESNMITGLNGKTPVHCLQEIASVVSPADQKLMKSALFIGVASDPFVHQPRHGDYLIRNLIGLDFNSGSLIVAGGIQAGQVVQFHLRDRKASHDDLDLMLSDYAAQPHAAPVGGILLLPCLGRGRLLYRSANHDSDLIRARLGTHPVGGFFANGEIGPIGATTYVHGYTSAIGVMRAPGSI